MTNSLVDRWDRGCDSRPLLQEADQTITQLHAAVKTAQELAARRLMEIERLRKDLRECRSHLTDVIASQDRPAIKAAADWLSDWERTRIDPGSASEPGVVGSEGSGGARSELHSPAVVSSRLPDGDGTLPPRLPPAASISEPCERHRWKPGMWNVYYVRSDGQERPALSAETAEGAANALRQDAADLVRVIESEGASRDAFSVPVELYSRCTGAPHDCPYIYCHSQLKCAKASQSRTNV